jgi:hypothetical protein
VTNLLQKVLETLLDIDFGYLEVAEEVEREWYLEDLEIAIDALEELGYPSKEGEQAIRYFITDPAMSRTYLYGPTDIGDGRGLIEKLKEGLGALS